MTDLLYERQGAFEDGREDVQLMVDAGILTPEKAAELIHVPKEDILSRKQ